MLFYSWQFLKMNYGSPFCFCVHFQGITPPTFSGATSSSNQVLIVLENCTIGVMRFALFFDTSRELKMHNCHIVHYINGLAEMNLIWTVFFCHDLEKQIYLYNEGLMTFWICNWNAVSVPNRNHLLITSKIIWIWWCSYINLM